MVQDGGRSDDADDPFEREDGDEMYYQTWEMGDNASLEDESDSAGIESCVAFAWGNGDRGSWCWGSGRFSRDRPLAEDISQIVICT